MKPQDLQALAFAAVTAPTFKPTAAAELMAAKVDRLGAVMAAIAQMKKEAEELRAELEDAGLKSIEGHIFRASFAQCAGATRTDWETIAQRFKPSAQLIRAHTTTGKPSTRLNVTARKITH